MKLYRVILPVTDIEHAASFYSEVLQMPGKRVSPGRHYFDCGGTILACFDPRADGDDFDARPNQEHIYIAVADVTSVLPRVRQAGSVRCDEHPAVQPWGEECFYAVDPFGNPLCFVNENTVFRG